MATSSRATGVVGYNVQTAVDDRHHLLVAHEAINIGNDRTQLAPMAQHARESTGIEDITVVADRGYFAEGGDPQLRIGRSPPISRSRRRPKARPVDASANRISAMCPRRKIPLSCRPKPLLSIHELRGRLQSQAPRLHCVFERTFLYVGLPSA